MKNRKRFTALAVAAALTFSMVSGTGSMVLADDDISMEAVESDTSAEELVSDISVSANDDNSAVTDESLSDSSEEVTESIENTADESSENDAAAENTAEETAVVNDGDTYSTEDDETAAYSIMLTSEETTDDIYTLSLDDDEDYNGDLRVGRMDNVYVVHGTCNGENITDFSDYTLTAVVDDETIAKAEVREGYKVGIDGLSPLTYSLEVTGLGVGSTTVTVLLQDENGNVLAASEKAPLTVNETDPSFEETYYTIEIDEDSIYPGQSLLVGLTRVDVTCTKVIFTDVSDKITSVCVYNNNDDYVISELFSVSGSTAEGWYVNVLDYGIASLIVNYRDGDEEGERSTWLISADSSTGTETTEPETTETETTDDIYTLSLDDSWEYTSNPSVGDTAIAYVIKGTCNGENITDFSDYTLTAVVDDETIAEAEIVRGNLLGIDGVSYTLNVNGLAVGSTTVTVLLQDENGNVLAASETVPVTVNETDNERTYYSIEIDEDKVFPGQSLPIKLTRVEVTSTKVISTDVSDTITDVKIVQQYVYDENNNYVTSGLFSVSGSTAGGWYLNVLDYGTVQLAVYYNDGDTASYESIFLQTSSFGWAWVTPEQSEYTVKVGESITIEFDTGYITVAKDGYERSNSYKNAYTVDATESYNGSAAYEYCSIECSDKNVTITGLKEGSADITIAMYTPGDGYEMTSKQLTIHVVSADSSTGTETTEPETTDTEKSETEKTETETTETETTETASTETNTTIAGVTETGTAETSATEATSTESTTETESESETEDPSVETGDNSPIEFYIAVMLLAMAIMVTGTFERRMRRN